MMGMPSSGRRVFLRSACKHCLGMGALLPGLPALAQEGAAAAGATSSPLPAERFVRPALETDEGGLWGMMDREEARLRRSPFVVRDSQLSKYLQDLVCRLAGDHCPDIRVHVVRTPLFNATMAPNGMMQVWTGLLLRAENEAQLAAILGHEIGHYLERHTLERLRDMRSRAAFAQFMGLFGVVGAIGQLGALAGAFAFSREHETRADRLGMRLMKRAGYDGQQAAQVWDNLLGELKVTGGQDAGKRSPMMATHPPVETRRDDLLKLAGDASGSTGTAEYQQAMSQYRFGWLQDEIRRGQFEESLVLFNRLLARNAQDSQALYARGEVYRLRAGKEDLQESLNDLTRVTALEQPPAEAFRALGLVQKQRTDGASAVQAFEKYLAVAPEAADAGLIKNYIAELKP